MPREYTIHGLPEDRLSPKTGTSDPDAVLHDQPHYTNPLFDRPRTVFCLDSDNIKRSKSGYEAVPDCFYVHHDRLRQSDSDKEEAARKHADAQGLTHRTARWYQAYLSHFYGYPVELVHIVAGINRNNGHPYLVFGTRGHPKE